MSADKLPFPTDFFDKVAATAQGRAKGWAHIHRVLDAPDSALIEDLRSGALAEVWTDSAAWLGDDKHMLTAELMSLGVFARGAGRRSAEDDLESFQTDYNAVVGDQSALIVALTDLVEQCQAEAAAWEARDLSLGKELRAQQSVFIDENISPALTDLCVRIVEKAQLNIWKVLARLMLAYLSADTGKDFQRAALGSRRKSGGLVDEKGFLRLYEQT